MKTHLLILGWLYTVMCGLALAVGLTLCVMLGLDPTPRSQAALPWLVPPFLLAACLLLIPGLVGGLGLLRLRPWARGLLLLPSTILLPLLPLGTALGIYGFWTLLNSETQALFAGSEQAVGRVSPRTPYVPSPAVNLLNVMAVVASAFFLILKIGFIIHHDPQPAPIASRTWTSAAILVFLAGAVMATLLAIQAGGRAASKARIRKSTNEVIAAHTEARRLRAAELAADPARAKYAPLVERGEDWSEENIAYDQIPKMTITCVHLQPIERDMRRAGIKARRYREQDISAQCRINYPPLERDYELGPPVRYAEFYIGERDADEHPAAFLICDEHKSIIHVLHPEEASAPKVPWFPSPKI